ncbi:hypothetical protein BH23ACT6_BH23ACT6_02930 [soil metagenome]
MTIIDCNTCPVRGRHCHQCFVPVVAGAWLTQGHESRGPGHAGNAPASREPDAVHTRRTAQTLPLTDSEWDAVDTFIGAGLINALDVIDLVARPESAPVSSWSHVG